MKCFRICDESFGLSTHLIHHMQRSHVRAELPYFCHICSYRLFSIYI